jgi:hypothetical protein
MAVVAVATVAEKENLDTEAGARNAPRFFSPGFGYNFTQEGTAK